MIRKQGDQTSKTIFPCTRSVHLQKSASFKTIFEQITINHTNDAKHDSKIIETNLKVNNK